MREVNEGKVVCMEHKSMKLKLTLGKFYFYEILEMLEYSNLRIIFILFNFLILITYNHLVTRLESVRCLNCFHSFSRVGGCTIHSKISHEMHVRYLDVTEV